VFGQCTLTRCSKGWLRVSLRWARL
jgi:hypothetical protein